MQARRRLGAAWWAMAALAVLCSAPCPCPCRAARKDRQLPLPPRNFTIDLAFVRGARRALEVRGAALAAKEHWEAILWRTDLVHSFVLKEGARGCASEPQTEVARNTLVDDLLVFVDLGRMDGPGGVTASSGPCRMSAATGNGPRLRFPRTAYIGLDEADVSSSSTSSSLLLVDLLKHEMGHALGLGVLWQERGLLLRPQRLAGAALPPPVTYAGAEGVAAFRAMTKSSTGQPRVEDNGGRGTALVHWEETQNEMGFQTELMTGWLNLDSTNPTSLLTVMALHDLGYVVDRSRAEPFSFRGRDLRRRRRSHVNEHVRFPPAEGKDEGRVVLVSRRRARARARLDEL